jgi:hypothetical protein
MLGPFYMVQDEVDDFRFDSKCCPWLLVVI